MDVLPSPQNAAPRARSATPGQRPRYLWQAPLFVLGLAALVAVWFLRPYFGEPPGRRSERELAEARRLLDHPHSEADAAARLLRQILDRGQLPENRVGEAHFLLGTAHLRLAERAGPDAAGEHWSQARARLEEADQRGVPEADQGKLLYRLGKAGFYTQDDPRRVAERLADSVNAADDRAEAYGLLTQAYLRLPEPDLQAALAANEHLRQQLVGEDVLAPARLLGGELLLRLQRPEEALQVLNRVGNQAAPAVQRQTHLLRARCYQDQKKWAEAANAYEVVLADGGDAAARDGALRYHLGLCYHRLDQPAKAASNWEACAKADRGDEGAAAALGLAELYLQPGQPDRAEEALKMIDRALADVRKRDDWSNKLLGRKEVCALLERCGETLRADGKYHLALQLATAYERLAPPGRAFVMRGDAATDWGKAKLRRASAAVPPGSLAKEDQAGRDLMRLAAESYAQAAAQTLQAAEQSDYLWLAVTRYVEARKYAEAEAALKQIYNIDQRPDRPGEGWYLLGEAYRGEKKRAADEAAARSAKRSPAEAQPSAAGKPAAEDQAALERLHESAVAAYQNCIAFPTPFAYRARYQLAQLALEKGQVDQAVTELEHNLTQLRGTDQDADAKLKSQFALSHIYYSKDKPRYDKVIEHLEKLADAFPTGPEAARAHYELADSYRSLAQEIRDKLVRQEYASAEAREHYEKEGSRLLGRAAAEFEQLQAELDRPDAVNHLGAAEARHVRFAVAQCRFILGDCQVALRAYEKLAERYKGQAEYWTAVAGIVSSYTGMIGNEREGQEYYAKMRARLEEIRDGLPRMNAEMRKQMEEYVKRVDQSLGLR